jgi:PTH1 family peptidyl-tRNA hydrolase
MLIVGLGNPGLQYEGTRHNFGFMVVDAYARQHGLRFRRTRYGAVAETRDQGWILKPHTFMNLSGQAVGPFCRDHHVAIGDLIVVCDDLDLPLGSLRIRRSGSSGGHNGLKSISAALGTTEFSRLRMGISRPPAEIPVIDWVLGRFPRSDRATVRDQIERAVAALDLVAQQGLEAAMSRYNG